MRQSQHTESEQCHYIRISGLYTTTYYIQSSATTLVKVILSLVQLKVSSTDIVKIIFTETSSQHSTFGGGDVHSKLSNIKY